MKTAIYAGAFNPPTRAHEEVIRGVLKSGIVDRLIFAPTGSRYDKRYGISDELRAKMLRIFYEKMKKEGNNIEYSDHFLDTKKSGETTTIRMNSYFENILSQKPFHIFGSDIIPKIHLWKGNENGEVEKDLKKIFIMREGYPIKEDTGLKESHFLTLGIKGLSSTIAREMIQTKKDVADILSPEIAQFIQTHHLYT